MNITRRHALMGATAAAVVTGAAVAPLAAQVDPVAVLARKAFSFRDWLNSTSDMPEEEFNAYCERLWELFDQIRDTPATSIEGIAGKVRSAWIWTDPTISVERNGPPDDFALVAQLDPQRFIWSARKDLERRAGEARS